MNSLRLLFSIFSRLANIGTQQSKRACHWLVAAMLIILFLPIAFIGCGMLAPSIALILAPALIFVSFITLIAAAVFMAPLLTLVATMGAIRAAEFSTAVRKIFTFLGTVIAVELLMGVYFAMVPTANDRPLVPLLVFFFMLLCFFKKKGGIRTFLILNVILFTVVLFLGGRDHVKDESERIGKSLQSTVAGASTRSVADPSIIRARSEYKPDLCLDPEHSQLTDISNRELSIGDKISIGLHEGCFANNYRLPTNKIYRVQMSGKPGDWLSPPWCVGDINPPAGPYRDPANLEHRFDHCINFRLQGKGTLTFIAIADKTAFY